MYRFFKRIFISIWVILTLTILVTVFVARKLPVHDQEPAFKQLAHHAALSIREQLKTKSRIDPVSFAQRNLLELDNTVQVFVIYPDGTEILGRSLDKDIPLLANFGDNSRAIILHEGLQGYTVVGYQRNYPFNRVLTKRGARVILGITALVISILVSLLLARFIVHPVKVLREAGQKVANGDLSVRVAHTVDGRSDDIAMLANDFDHMTMRIDELLEKQKLLMRDVSHELRSPLARLQAFLSLTRQELEHDVSKFSPEYIDKMECEIERLNSLIERILIFTRLDSKKEISRHNTDLVDLLTVIAEDASIEGLEQNKDIIVSGLDSFVAKVDSALIHSAFENVIRNALRYTKPNTKVQVLINKQAEHLIVKVSDSGPGVPEEKLASLFEPFFRVEEARTHKMGGGGIGLAIVQRAMKLHGGSVQANNRPKGGLTVTMIFPIDYEFDQSE